MSIVQAVLRSPPLAEVEILLPPDRPSRQSASNWQEPTEQDRRGQSALGGQTMQVGMNMLLWTSHVTDAHVPIMAQIRATGFDGVEIPVFEGTADHYAKLGTAIRGLGLAATAISVIPSADRNPVSPDPAVRAAALDYLKYLVDCSVAMGSPLMSGPLHSTLGQFSGIGVTADEKAWALDVLRAAGDYAAKHKVTVCLEALNRFESYFANTMHDLCAFLDQVDHSAVHGMYDTFHANIEERDPTGVIGASMRHIRNVHISENDRGVPGRGNVPWRETYRALRYCGYDGWLTIEAFGRGLPELAAATRVWRDLSPSPEAVYRDGHQHIRAGWAAT
jgi:D-psicose/D-tagatose/L-ribulose 3-epimerase